MSEVYIFFFCSCILRSLNVASACFLFFSESPFSLKVDSKSSVQPNRGDANSSQSSSGKSSCEMSGISDTPQFRSCRNAELLEDTSGLHGVCVNVFLFYWPKIKQSHSVWRWTHTNSFFSFFTNIYIYFFYVNRTYNIIFFLLFTNYIASLHNHCIHIHNETFLFFFLFFAFHLTKTKLLL